MATTPSICCSVVSVHQWQQEEKRKQEDEEMAEGVSAQYI